LGVVVTLLPQIIIIMKDIIIIIVMLLIVLWGTLLFNQHGYPEIAMLGVVISVALAIWLGAELEHK
jgi:hypothetical protein